MVRVGSTDGAFGDYKGDKQPVAQEKDPKSIKVFNFEPEDSKQVRKSVASKNRVDELKNKPHSEKEILKACRGDKELLDALVKAGYVEKTPDGQYKISGLSDAFAKFSDPVDGSINEQAAKAVLFDAFGDCKIDRISDKQTKKLAKLCGFNVKNDGLKLFDFMTELAGLGSVINDQEMEIDK